MSCELFSIIIYYLFILFVELKIKTLILYKIIIYLFTFKNIFFFTFSDVNRFRLSEINSPDFVKTLSQGTKVASTQQWRLKTLQRLGYRKKFFRHQSFGLSFRGNILSVRNLCTSAVAIAVVDSKVWVSSRSRSAQISTTLYGLVFSSDMF